MAPKPQKRKASTYMPYKEERPAKQRRATEADLESAFVNTVHNLAPRRHTDAGLEKNLEGLSRTNDQIEFREKVERAAEGTPRFLFRFWHKKSGGNSQLNTVHAIIPLRFLDHRGPVKSFYMRNQKELGSVAKYHVGYSRHKEFRTVFSSWSQSLALLLGWARDKVVNEGVEGMHISILDTTKLDKANVILHTEALKDLFHTDMHTYEWEYLIYGPVSGPAYRAIPYDVFESPEQRKRTEELGIPELGHIFDDDSVGRRIDVINTIARCYGSPLEIPVAAHMTALVIYETRDEHRRHEYLKRMIKSMPIPLEWASDKTIINRDVDYHGVEEAFDADELLREMVQMTFERPKKTPNPKKKVRFDLDDGSKHEPKSMAAPSRRPTKAEAQKAVESVTKSERLPEAAKTLYQRIRGSVLYWTGWGN